MCTLSDQSAVLHLKILQAVSTEQLSLSVFLQVKLKISDFSDMTQWIMLEADSKYIKFDTSVCYYILLRLASVKIIPHATKRLMSKGTRYECSL